MLRSRVSTETRRRHGKIVEIEELDQLLARHDLFQPIAGRSNVTLDMNELSAEEAAEHIVELLHPAASG